MRNHLHCEMNEEPLHWRVLWKTGQFHCIFQVPFATKQLSVQRRTTRPEEQERNLHIYDGNRTKYKCAQKISNQSITHLQFLMSF